MPPSPSLVRRFIVLAAIAVAAGAAPAQPAPAALSAHGSQRGDAPLDQATDAQLEAFYLACSAAAMDGRLHHAGIAGCSQGYEALLQRRFAGDFMRLLAWSRQQPVHRPAMAGR